MQEPGVAAPRKVLLDTDIGSDVDDALALGLMLAAGPSTMQRSS